MVSSLTKVVFDFTVTQIKGHKMILKPLTKIPACEKWLLDNKSALKMLKRGLQDAATGRVTKKSGFAQYAGDEIE